MSSQELLILLQEIQALKARVAALEAAALISVDSAGVGG